MILQVADDKFGRENGPDDRARPAEQLVARLVAKAVVVKVHAMDIEEDDQRRPALVQDGFERALRELAEVVAVGQARDIVQEVAVVLPLLVSACPGLARARRRVDVDVGHLNETRAVGGVVGVGFEEDRVEGVIPAQAHADDYREFVLSRQ